MIKIGFLEMSRVRGRICDVDSLEAVARRGRQAMMLELSPSDPYCPGRQDKGTAFDPGGVE